MVRKWDFSLISGICDFLNILQPCPFYWVSPTTRVFNHVADQHIANVFQDFMRQVEQIFAQLSPIVDHFPNPNSNSIYDHDLLGCKMNTDWSKFHLVQYIGPRMPHTIPHQQFVIVVLPVTISQTLRPTDLVRQVASQLRKVMSLPTYLWWLYQRHQDQVTGDIQQKWPNYIKAMMPSSRIQP